MNKNGIILGQVKVVDYVDDSKSNVLMISPTMTYNKEAGIVKTLQESWTESIVVIDFGCDLYDKTHIIRKEEFNNNILNFNPTSRDTVRYNPLLEIRFGTECEKEDINLIVNVLSGRLYFEDENDINQIKDGLYSLIENAYKNDKLTFAEIYTSAMELSFKIGLKYADAIKNEDIDELEKVRHDYIISTKIVDKLKGFDDLNIRNATSTSDFKLDDIVKQDNPTSLYLCNKFNYQLYKVEPLIRMILSQLIVKTTSDVKYDSSQHNLLLYLDDIDEINKIYGMVDGLGYMSGFNTKAIIKVHSLDGLKKIYGDEYIKILDNCGIKIFTGIVGEDSRSYLLKYIDKPALDGIKVRDYIILNGNPKLPKYEILKN